MIFVRSKRLEVFREVFRPPSVQIQAGNRWWYPPSTTDPSRIFQKPLSCLPNDPVASGVAESPSVLMP